MNDLIYYPGFEIKDESWLKFALLYVDHLHPIIPHEGFDHLSDKTRYIMEMTDLIKPYSPDFREAEKASQIVLNQFDNYLKNPERYISSNGFGKKTSSILQENRANNLINKWKNKDNQNYVLFSEKYSWAFNSYCLKEGLAHDSYLGLNISEELAYVYMSFLADEIAKNKGLDSITDHFLSNELLLSKERHTDKHLNIVKRSIQLELPKNIHDIELTKIIQLRNNSHFNTLRNTYIDEITKYFKKINANECDYINNSILLSCKKEIANMILSFLGIALSISFGVVAVVCATPLLGTVPSVLGLPSVRSVIKSEKELRKKLMPKKYLAEMKIL